ncbi:hypothetical protein OKW43_007644 [Paraburkholderia sp. WC7.3g]
MLDHTRRNRLTEVSQQARRGHESECETNNVAVTAEALPDALQTKNHGYLTKIGYCCFFFRFLEFHHGHCTYETSGLGWQAQAGKNLEASR